ncbi:MAG TPA: WhiB family transcriptional regulator [Nocardioidaceae bacterium]|nr:WhiB family transcriptional regulator [Nocardioidaceae bacterium]
MIDRVCFWARQAGGIATISRNQLGHASRVSHSSGAPPCAGPQADLFFAEDAAWVKRAKALCATCPSRMPCLAGALERREPWGVWGGELFHGGTVVAYRRRRGRPPKSRGTARRSRPGFPG